jgi:gamma-glutamylcyclotransferase
LSTYQYAAYGSNLHPLRLQKRVPSTRFVGSSFISGYELNFDKKSNIDGTGKCTINRGNGVVHLAVFEIEAEEKVILDRCEGLGNGYEEISIDAHHFGNCLTYIADPAVVDETLRPTDWYKEMVLLGCRSHSFPEEYIRAIEVIRSIEDRNERRSRMNWKIVAELRNDA